jgi:hypothetical protein
VIFARLTGQEVRDDPALIRLRDDHCPDGVTESGHQIGQQVVALHDYRRRELDMVGDDGFEPAAQLLRDSDRVLDDACWRPPPRSRVGIPEVQHRCLFRRCQCFDRGHYVIGLGERHPVPAGQRDRDA